MRRWYPRLLALPRPLRLVVGGAAVALVVLASMVPGVSGEEGVLDWRVYVQNGLHLVLYGVVAVALALAFGLDAARAGRRLLLPLAGALALAVLDEWLQGANPARSSSVWDLGTDLFGAAFALRLAAWSSRDAPFPWGTALLFVGLAAAWTLVPSFAPEWPLRSTPPPSS